MRRRRKQLAAANLKLGGISLPSYCKKINFLAFILLCMPAVYSISLMSICSIRKAAKYEAFGNEVKDPVLQILLINFKWFMYIIVYPTSVNFIVLLLCTFCLRCSSLISNMVNEISGITPEKFGPSMQIHILRVKARVDESLCNLQDVFSLPILFIIVAHLLSCSTSIGWFLYYGFKHYHCAMRVQAAFFGINSSVSLIIMFWVAGGVPGKLQRLKETFFNKSHLRLILSPLMNEPQFKREILDKPDFVFTGYDIISLRRRTLFVLFGSMITYTVLVVSTRDFFKEY
ncbi:hypothetical protein AVEN_40702-1 [Araneus ventricosus]|uniref:Gustatory receptor n=1 Tax=Araneus ventricosus TaxID=182803 RepID=A0A4Y2RLK5_ARAVE|nr:hypothetical protein AVEN_40702-1 [Araneus ventricosus]